MVADLAEGQHGVVARWQLLDRGVRRGAIEVRIGRKQLNPVHRGVYAVGRRTLDVKGLMMAAVLACGPGAVLSHRSAGELWGILPRRRGVPEVTSRAPHRRPGIVVRRGSVPADERGTILGIPVTSLARTLFDLGSVLSRRELERAFHEAEVRGLTGRLSVPHLLERYPRRRGAQALREVLASKQPVGITRNEFEERFVALLDAHDLPRPRMNAALHLRGRFIEADCLWTREKVIVELDGRGVHDTDRGFERDRRRDRELLAEGWRSARVTWRQLSDEPEAVAADLRRLLAVKPTRRVYP